MPMDDLRYQEVLNLFHEDNDAFWQLPQRTLNAFFDRLYNVRR